jgi:hypothetical protein
MEVHMTGTEMSKPTSTTETTEGIYCTVDELGQEEIRQNEFYEHNQTSATSTNQSNNNHASITTQKKIAEAKFDKFLAEAIDETLLTLGTPVLNAFYFHLENDFRIRKNDIPNKIEDFSYVIHKMFGLGAGRLEVKFMKNLQSKIQIDVEWPECEWPLSKWIITDMSFVDYIRCARDAFIKSK